MLLAFPSKDVVWDAEVAMSNEDALYPATNAKGNKPSLTSKSTTTNSTYQIDTDGNVTVVGLALINTNYTTGALSSGAGAIGSFVFPSYTPDGKPRNGFLDLRELPNRTDDHFEIALSKTGAAFGELGRICLVTEWQAPHVRIAPAPVFGRRRPGQIENVSRGGDTWRRPAPWAAVRRLNLHTQEADSLAILDQLEAESLGLDRGFLFVPNEDVNDAWFAQCELADFDHAQELTDDVADGIFRVRMTIQELAMGLPPDPD